MMQTKRAWWALTAGLLGLVFSYTLTLAHHGTAFAGAMRCPAAAHEACKGGDCMHNPSCQSGTCSSECPGNCGMKPKNV
jgi:hypothetical protein